MINVKTDALSRDQKPVLKAMRGETFWVLRCASINTLRECLLYPKPASGARLTLQFPVR